MLGSMVVIPAGSPATGEVTDVRRKGMWGKSGRITARVLNVRVGDRLIRLTGTFDDKGVTGTAGVVAAIAFVPIAGFFMTGTSARFLWGRGSRRSWTRIWRSRRRRRRLLRSPSRQRRLRQPWRCFRRRS